MPRLLITGASGFVGRSLLPILCRTGYRELVLLDRHPLPQSTREAFTEAGGIADEVVADCLPDPSLFPDVESVICLAGTTSVDAALSTPRPAIDGNIHIAVDLVEWARLRKIPPYIVYISSDEVLGDSIVALPETAELRPTQPYAASKAAAEIIVHCYRDVYNVRVASLRSCNLVGPGQREPKLIPVATRALLKNEPVPIHGSGQQLREWMSVQDLARAIALLVSQQASPQVYQAATGVHLSVSQVVELVAEALGRPVSIRHVEDRLIQDKCYAMQASRLNDLGWSPEHDPVRAIKEAALSIAQEWDAYMAGQTMG